MLHLQSVSLKRRHTIRRLLPLVVHDSAISQCGIFSIGHPNGTEPLTLAVPRSMYWTSKDHKNKLKKKKKISSCFKISLKSPVRMRPVRMWQSSGSSNILCSTGNCFQSCGRGRKLAVSHLWAMCLVLGIYRLSFTLSSGEKLKDLSFDICYPGAIMCCLIGWRSGRWASRRREEEVSFFAEVKPWSSASVCLELFGCFVIFRLCMMMIVKYISNDECL